MDADNLLSGRRVHEGEVIGQVSNFSIREAGTSYHVHFDIQVPTRHGWVFVNPYMTLVAAYERLIGERGAELSDPSVVASTDPANTAAVMVAARVEPDPPKRASSKHSRKKSAKHSRHKSKHRHKQRLARR